MSPQHPRTFVLLAASFLVALGLTLSPLPSRAQSTPPPTTTTPHLTYDGWLYNGRTYFPTQSDCESYRAAQSATHRGTCRRFQGAVLPSTAR